MVNTNVLLDYLLMREPFYEEAFVEELKKVWSLLENKSPDDVLQTAEEADAVK